MKDFLKKYLAISLLCFCFAGCRPKITISLHGIFSDNMVLQQNSNVKFLGKTLPGRHIKINANWTEKTYLVKADQKGNWITEIPTPRYGGPYNIDFFDGTKLTLRNVMIGEVWLCSGQSNMEMPLGSWGEVKDFRREIYIAEYPNIRLLNVMRLTSNQPKQDLKVSNGGWQQCSPETIENFSSVGYFFARELYKKTRIPIGLINASWGGTIIEAWTSGRTLKSMDDFGTAVKMIERATPENANFELERATKHWKEKLLANDAGYKNNKAIWSEISCDTSSWKKINIPGFWNKDGLSVFDGVIWLRRIVNIPTSMAGKDLRLNLGTIDDHDITFFDGKKIGETSGYKSSRIYHIGGREVKSGSHVVTVRILDIGGNGGIYARKNVLSLNTPSGESISLDGEWRYKIGMNLKQIGAFPTLAEGLNQPTVLYNSMINPLIQFRIRGVIWYQGESNIHDPNQYRKLFPAMINDWRQKWNIGNFPFYYVQLANFKSVNNLPSVSDWAALRDAQLKAIDLPNTGMAVAIDVGDAKDIHPKNKQEIGRRLSLIALSKTYGYGNSYSGPIYSGYEICNNKVNLKFKFTEEGFNIKGGSILKGFSVAGNDRKFYWAKAIISGDRIVVSSDMVNRPTAVRYGWADNPVCNLYNKAGLPASPFRTDNWFD